jgi:LmbE family N-acetylglucosaminyl deacetylase
MRRASVLRMSALLRVLHVSPHPDDEVIGAPATLFGLRDAGHEVVNLAVGLGSSGQQERRERELREANVATGFETIVHDPPLAISAGDDLALAQRTLTGTVGRLLDERGFDLVISPSPHDGHHGHEAVGRAVRDALAATPDGAATWWIWSLWADLPLPTLYVPFDDARLAGMLQALGAYHGEIARNDYPTMVRARAEANRVLGAERVFGYGSAAKPGPYAELLSEVVRQEGAWLACAPRMLDVARPLDGQQPQLPFGWWLDGPSIADRVRAERARVGAEATLNRSPTD